MGVALIVAASWSFAWAESSTPSPGGPEDLKQRGPSSAGRPEGNTGNDEPEEPDFAFIAGGPYTQRKNSIQFIFPTQWGRGRSNVGGSILQHAEFGTLLRTEWGLTDRWELDVMFSAEGERDFLGQRRVNSTFAMSDSVMGARYRLLQESSSPFTLAMGPQFIIPTGSFLSGTGNEKVGYAWDMAAAKDWGGPVFLYTSLNYAFFPSVRVLGSSSSRNFTLHNLFWGTALGFRPLEETRGTSHHDIHFFLENGLGREQSLAGNGTLAKVSETLAILAPGIRYGFLTRNRKLFEFGVSIPIGLNQSTPRGGVILQIQFEQIFGYRGVE